MTDMKSGWATKEQCEKLIEESRGDGCLFCRFFEMIEEATATTSSVFKDTVLLQVSGECRRHSPVVQMFEDSDDNLTIWPEVNDKGWCGDFELSRKITNADQICSAVNDPKYREFLTSRLKD